ncbi:MAG: DegV family EDD domain-containing protein [Mycoplasma sp.]|nr:DegV family EDD domain-containing protein [Mycoplasma sp.]
MNKKLAIVISSFSALLEKDIEKYDDIYLTPLQLFIENEQWLEGFYDDKTKYEIVEKFKLSEDFKTSLAPIGVLEEQIKELSSKYDEVIYLPINSYLSSSHNTILNLSKNFKNVHVINNKLVGHAFLEIALEAKKLYEEKNYSINEIIEIIKSYDQKSIGYIIPHELRTFIKSGRLKGIKKTIMSSLKLSTIVEFDYELNSVGIVASRKLGAQKVIQKIESFIKKQKMNIDDFKFTIIYAFDKTIANVFKEAVEKQLGKKIDDMYESSLATMFHTGWGASFLGINPKIKLSLLEKK